jgi:hypothetical protein
MSFVDLALSNLATPPVLGFALGYIAKISKSDLQIPEALYQGLAIYLLFAIGLKGGVQLAENQPDGLGLAIAGTFVLGIVTALLAFALWRWLGRFDRANSAALAAHYGSVSAVTYIVGSQFLQMQQLSVESFFPALVAILEVVGIFVALLLIPGKSKVSDLHRSSGLKTLHHTLVSSGILLLIGSFAIGFIAGPSRVSPVAPLFIEPFVGVLTLFLLQMGVSAASQWQTALGHARHLIGLGILIPILHGILGLCLGVAFGFSQGGAVMFGILGSSASYIAAPASIRMILPEANPSFYITASLGITFPFNLTIGIPLYAWIYTLIF